MRKPQPIIDRVEANAAIDRAVDTLKSIKVQLKAKKLNGSALSSLLMIAQGELQGLDGPFHAQWDANRNEIFSSVRGFME